MSLSYRVSLQVSEVVSADDKTIHQLDLRDILSEDEMRDLLKNALIERGFESEDDDKTLSRKEEGGERVSVDLETLQLTTTLEDESEVRAKVDAWGDAESRAAAQRQAEGSARAQADALVARGRQDVQRRVTQQLAEGEAARLEEMNQVLQGVYSEALKRKARQMGEVVSQHEGTNEAGEYELVIKIAL